MSLKYGWWASALLLTCWAAAAWAGAGTDGRARLRAGRLPAPVGRLLRRRATAMVGMLLSANTASRIEKPPRIKFKRVCPKPVCNPCDIEGYGYYPTCWRPWAYPPNYGHCPVPPPGVLASQPPPLVVHPGVGPGASPDETLPPPQKTANPNPDR